MAAVLAKGVSIFKNISIEPEVIDLINFLNKSGAKIKFIGKRTIRIEGKEFLNGEHEIIGDRIEAFSYLCVGAISKGKVTVNNVDPKFLNSELITLKKLVLLLILKGKSISLNCKKKLKPINFKTALSQSLQLIICQHSWLFFQKYLERV